MYKLLFLLSFTGATAVVDLQAMWYPTVRRTLVCLSKLYNSIGVSAFFLFNVFVFEVVCFLFEFFIRTLLFSYIHIFKNITPILTQVDPVASGK